MSVHVAMDVEAVFERIKDHVRSTRPSVVRGWFRKLRPDSLEAGSLNIRVQNAAQKEYLERFASDAFTVAAQAVTGRLVNVVFRYDGTGHDEPATEPEALRLRPSAIDPFHRLDSFAIGPCNRLAHAAVSAVLEQPGTVYNPLFIWGPAGVGKTHLVQGLTVRAEAEKGSAVARRCWYVTAPDLIAQLIESLEGNIVDEVRREVSGLTFVVVDDVDLFENRERSQEEFFHFLNRALDHHVQLVLVATRAPGELRGIPDRLRTRFAAGLVVGMDPPCTQTREEIIRRHAKARCIDLAEELAAMLAQSIDSAPELVNTLIRLDSLSQIRGTSINREIVDEVLQNRVY